jgi:hypothetical protein
MTPATDEANPVQAPAPPAELWVIAVRPLAGESAQLSGVPVAARMKHLLKDLLRKYELRCVGLYNDVPAPLGVEPVELAE